MMNFRGHNSDGHRAGAAAVGEAVQPGGLAHFRHRRQVRPQAPRAAAGHVLR